MNIEELISILSSYPKTMRVIIDGYEGGFHDIEKIKIREIPICLNVNDDWYFGEHDNPRENQNGDEIVLLISRNNEDTGDEFEE